MRPNRAMLLTYERSLQAGLVGAGLIVPVAGPRMIIRSLRLRAEKIVFGDAKRLLQHYLPQGDFALQPTARRKSSKGQLMMDSCNFIAGLHRDFGQTSTHKINMTSQRI